MTDLDWEDIYDNIEELIDMITKVIGNNLPPDYRVGDENGQEAFAREIVKPLNNIQCICEEVPALPDRLY